MDKDLKPQKFLSATQEKLKIFIIHQMRKLILKSISFHLLQHRLYEDRRDYSRHVDIAEISPATPDQFPPNIVSHEDSFRKEQTATIIIALNERIT